MRKMESAYGSVIAMNREMTASAASKISDN